MEAHHLTDIYSWDTGLDRVPGIVRVEPADGGDQAP
jgi:hypothetical protein